MTDQTRTLDNLIVSISDAMRSRTRAGWKTASALSDAIRQKVIDAVDSSLEKGLAGIDVNQIAKLADITEAEARNLILALTTTVSTLGQVTASADAFVACAEGKLFDKSEAPVARSIAQAFQGRSSALQQAYKRAELASATLPALRGFFYSIDLRLGFEDDNLNNAVPVAVVHILTDGDPELWFQMGRGDVERVIDKLNSALKQLDIANRLFEEAKKRV